MCPQSVETSFGYFVLGIRTWKSGRTGLRGDMTSKVSVLSYPLMVRENSSFPLLVMPGMPFPQEHQRGAGSRRDAWAHILCGWGQSPGMVVGQFVLLQPPGRGFPFLRTNLIIWSVFQNGGVCARVRV